MSTINPVVKLVKIIQLTNWSTTLQTAGIEFVSSIVLVFPVLFGVKLPITQTYKNYGKSQFFG
jgi:hypothetical protein